MDLYSTNYLTGVVNSLQAPPSFLFDKYFTTEQTETSEEIHFDTESDVMGLAPFVSPVVEGKVMSNQGFTTSTFKPAYIKPKNVVDPGMALKRQKGEAIGGAYTPQQRLQMIVAATLANHRKLVARRLEWMAAKVLTTGKVTISGDQYQTREVDFKRLASHTFTASTLWSVSTANPLDDLQTWRDLILADSGSVAVDVVMEVGAWKAFRSNANVVKRLELQRRLGELPSLNQNAISGVGGALMGQVDGFNIWAYAGSYKDDSGAVQKMLPNGTVLMVGELGGVRAFGAIQDEEAGIQAIPYFSKSWVQPDPSRRFIMTQSAPLLVPYRTNASACATVL